MNDINKTIKHFESQQKRYKTQHGGKSCERIEDALEALRWIYSLCGEEQPYIETVCSATVDHIEDEE